MVQTKNILHLEKEKKATGFKASYET